MSSSLLTISSTSPSPQNSPPLSKQNRSHNRMHREPPSSSTRPDKRSKPPLSAPRVRLNQHNLLVTPSRRAGVMWTSRRSRTPGTLQRFCRNLADGTSYTSTHKDLVSTSGTTRRRRNRKQRLLIDVVEPDIWVTHTILFSHCIVYTSRACSSSKFLASPRIRTLPVPFLTTSSDVA